MTALRYRSGGRTSAKATHTTIWLWLTAPVAVLVAVAAGNELLVGGLFRGDTPYFVAQAVGQDVVTLGITLPALVIGAVLASRGSERARMVWLGALAYLVYTYAIYAFQVHFNPLFLVYVALFGSSLYALIGELATVDPDGFKARFSGRTLVKAVSIFLAVVAALFYFAWLSEVIPALVAGEVPQSVAQNGTPTNAVHVLDMAWILPAAILTAVWLWSGRAIGYVLAGVLLTFFGLLALAIVAMMVSMNLYGQAVALGMAAVFGTVSAVSLMMLYGYSKGIRQSQ